MKKLIQLFCTALLIACTTTTNAQLGGLLKKAKDKITAPKEIIRENIPAENTTKAENIVTEKAVEQTLKILDASIVYKANGYKVFRFTAKNITNTAINLEENKVKARYEFRDRADERWYSGFEGDAQLSNIKKLVVAGETITGEVQFRTAYKYGNSGGSFNGSKEYCLTLFNDNAAQLILLDRFPVTNITHDDITNTNFIFSNKKFTDGNNETTTSFKSSDHIYARLQLKNGTVKDVFKIAALTTKQPYYSLEYSVCVAKTAEDEEGDSRDRVGCDNRQRGSHFLLKESDLNKNYLDIDILPEPSKATTAMSPFLDFSGGLSSVPLFNDVNQSTYPKDGKYRVQIVIGNYVNDAWGNALPEKDWPMFDGIFDFNFTTADIALLKGNEEKARENVKNSFGLVVAKNEPMHNGWTLQSSTPGNGYSVAKYNQEYLRYYPKAKIVKTYLKPDDGWNVVKDNDNFLPIYKYSSQWVTYFCKTPEGRCYYHTCNLRQKYEGGGTYGAKFLAVFDSEITYVDCEKMK